MFVTFVISIVKDSHIQVVFYAFSMQDRPTFGVLSNQGFCHLCSVANTTENFQKLNLERKQQNFWFMEKHIIIQFSYMEKCLS